MERNPIRNAEIVALRRRVAGGSRDIEHVYCPLAHALAETGERDEAIAVYRAAIQCSMEDGFVLKAIACLRAAQELAPGDSTLATDEAQLQSSMDPALWACAARVGARTAMTAVPTAATWHDALERCMVSWSVDDGSGAVTIYHPNRSVPTDEVERAQYALIVDGCLDAIPCHARIAEADRTHHQLTLVPASAAAAAAIRWNIRVRPEIGQSNIAALAVTPMGGSACRLRNVYYDVPAEASN